MALIELNGIGRSYFVSGSELKVTLQDANKKPIELSVPLLGFGLAFDKARS